MSPTNVVKVAQTPAIFYSREVNRLQKHFQRKITDLSQKMIVDLPGTAPRNFQDHTHILATQILSSFRDA